MNTVTEFNVGRFCLSEDECIAQGINFTGYERGVSDAAQAFALNARQRPALPTVDELAQEIRRVDGKHTLGAGALAEKLHEWLSQRPADDRIARLEGLLGLAVGTLNACQPRSNLPSAWDVLHNTIDAIKAELKQ
jgi:hypothetical protein